MKYALYLGKIVGVKIFVHWTFIFLIGWIVSVGLRQHLRFEAILWILGLNMAVFACIVVHELSHAVMARRFHIVTRHITLLPIGGIAQLETIPRKPKQELLIALAGPASNLVIALLLLPFTGLMAWATELPAAIQSTNFLLALAAINVWLAVFNLIPAFPMDGGRVLRAVLSLRMDYSKATRAAVGIGQAFGAAFFVGGFLYYPMLSFIGLFVFLGGQLEYTMVDTMDLLHAFTVRDVLMREIPTLENSLTVGEAGQRLLATQNKSFVVTAGGEPIGALDRDEIIRAGYRNGKDAAISAIKEYKPVFVDVSLPLDEAWKMMREEKTSLLLVRTKGHLDGMVDEENLNEFMLLKSADRERKKL